MNNELPVSIEAGVKNVIAKAVCVSEIIINEIANNDMVIIVNKVRVNVVMKLLF